MFQRTMTLSQAVAGFQIAMDARGLSPNTIADYNRSLKRLMAYLPDDPQMAAITVDDVARFMASLDQPHAPAGVAARHAMNVC